MYVRCVGAATTCAGIEERQLFYTAVFFFSICSIAYRALYIKLGIHTNMWASIWRV